VPALVLVAGWLVPGAGHLLLGKWVRALLLFVSVLGMYLIGLALQGKVYTPNFGDILDMLGFLGQLGMGLLYVLARAFGWGATSMVNTLSDYGTKFLIVAGLLNLRDLRHHPARTAQKDVPLWCLLLCALRRRSHRGQLAHVGHQALAQFFCRTQTVSSRPEPNGFIVWRS